MIAFAVVVAASVARVAAIDIDRYGNSHVTLQDMQNAANQYSRDSLNAYNERAKRNSSTDSERVMSESEKQEAYRKALRQSIYDESVAANARYEASMRRWAAEAEAARKAKEEARKADIEGAERVRLGFIEKFANEQRRIAAVILNAESEKVSPTRYDYINSEVVVGFAEGLITGSFRDQSLADLQVTLSPEERFATALKLYGDFNFYDERYGHKENHNLQQGFSPAAFVPDLITPAALSFGGHGDYVLRNIRGHSLMLAAPDGAISVVAALAAALNLPEAEFDGARRQQALFLLAGIMPRLKLQGDDGTALAALLVAAAQKNPELAGVKILPDQFVPLVRDSIWAQGFKSMQLPTTDRQLAALPPMTSPFWNLASMLVLAGSTDKPMDWFVRIRDCRRQNKLGPADAAEKAVVQQALQDWFVRIQVSPGIQRAIQADCNLACDVPVADLAKAKKWDGFVSWIYSNTLPDLTNRATSVKELLDSGSLGQIGANSFLAFTSSRLDLPNQLLVESCEDRPDRSQRARTALCRLTDIDDAITFRDIPKSRWEALVTLGEGYRQANDQSWLEPEVSARLARIRSERLGDEAGAFRWLSDPAHQPKDSDGAEKWQSWAARGGRAGLIVALPRHPEYFGESALVLERIKLLSADSQSPETKAALKVLMGYCKDVIDPEAVLMITYIRGPLLGEWAELGTWLEDPRRRPQDKSFPRYTLYLISTIAREYATGYWSKIKFDAAAKPANDTERIVHEAIDDLADELAESEVTQDRVDAEMRHTVIRKLLEPLTTEPGVRSLLAHAMVGGAERIHSAALAHHTATGTDREYAMAGMAYPPTYRVKELAGLALRWKEISPVLRSVAANLIIDDTGNYSEKLGLLAFLDDLIMGESDPLVDPVAYLAGQATSQTEQENALQRRALLRVAKSPRGSLLTATPWESIPRVAASGEIPPPEATLAATTAFESAAVGSPERGKLADALVAVQLKADEENPFERSAQKALYIAASRTTDDGVAALAYATLIRREHKGIPWAYPPASRLVTDLKSLSAFSFRDKENDWYTRSREANGFAALVLAYQKKVPGARTRLLELYDPELSDETRFALGNETGKSLVNDSGDFAQLGTRARLAAVGTKDAASWLQRVTALPSAEDEAGLATLYIHAVRAHAHPEMITAELLRMVWHDTAGNAERAALRTLIADADAPRFFGSAWRDDSPSPFKTAWMLAILDQKAAQQLPVPEDDFSRPLEAESAKLMASVPEGTDVPEEIMARVSAISGELGNHRVAYQEQKMRERMRGLSPKTAMLLAFSSARTTSELARTIVHDEPSSFIDNLVKFAVESDPSLQTLSLRYSSSAIIWKPLTPEHWSLLAEGKLWPLPEGVSEAN